MFQYANANRYIYNWTLEQQKLNYDNGGKFISDGDLRKKLTQLKKTEDYNWLNNVSNNVTKQSVKDACDGYKRFFKGSSQFPKFKSKKKTRPSFYQDNVKIKFTNTHVKFEGFTPSKKKNKQKLNWVRLAEKNRIPTDCKYYNPRVTFDGTNWWISVGIDYEESTNTPTNDGIGIDLGIKDLAICSDGNTYKSINKTSKLKKLNKKKRRLQKQVSRKYEMNKKGGIKDLAICSDGNTYKSINKTSKLKKLNKKKRRLQKQVSRKYEMNKKGGNRYCKTSNIKKLEHKLLKLNHRISNIRNNYQHQVTSEIIKEMNKKGGNRYCKTSNIKKLEHKLLKLNHRISNIRNNYQHQVTSEIIKREPSFIGLEDLNIKGMMKNKHLSKAIQEQGLYDFKCKLSYKAQWNNIKIVDVPRFFPSSKTCSNCGSYKGDLKLSDRTYKCESCGIELDRDYNASLNLKQYGESTLNH